MSFIECNIVIDLPDGSPIEPVVEQLQAVLKQLNGKDTNFNVTNQDNPITGSPITLAKGQ